MKLENRLDTRYTVGKFQCKGFGKPSNLTWYHIIVNDAIVRVVEIPSILGY